MKNLILVVALVISNSLLSQCDISQIDDGGQIFAIQQCDSTFFEYDQVSNSIMVYHYLQGGVEPAQQYHVIKSYEDGRYETFHKSLGTVYIKPLHNLHMVTLRLFNGWSMIYSGKDLHL